MTPTDLSVRASRRWLAAIVLLYVALAAWMGWRNPLFEAPDEHHHYFTAEFIALNRTLPVVGDAWLRQEAAQPPLYYALGAAIIAPFPLDGALSRAQVTFNPYARLGDPTSAFNINAFVQSAESPIYAAPAHALRLLSTLFGIGTLCAMYGSAWLVWRRRAAALVAAALVAFLPQFIFTHSTITNDTLIILLSTAVLWQLLRRWYGAPNARHDAAALIMIGLSAGLAALTKNQGVLLLALACGVTLWQARRDRLALPQAVRNVALVAVAGTACAGWLWWRNWALYGDVTAANQFIALAGGDRGFTLAQVWGERRLLWSSFIGSFGWQNVNVPFWVYQLWLGVFIIGAAGFLRVVWRRSVPLRPLLWLWGWFGLVLAAHVAFMLRTPAAQGRLLFPALLPLALTVGGGVVAWRSRWLTLGIVSAVALSALWSAVGVLPPAYALPQAVTAIPADAQRLEQPLGDGLVLAAARVETDVAQPGGDVWLTLYWRTTAALDDAPLVSVALKGRNFTPVGEVRSWHGRGQYPATLWPVETVVADRFALPLRADMAVPTLVRVQVTRVDAPEVAELTPVKVVPDRWPQADGALLATIEPGIEVREVMISAETVTPGDTLTVDVTWHTTAPVSRALTTFVHLLTPDETALLAQGDAPPLGGDYPTWAWDAGETIRDRYTVPIPADLAPGTYPLWLGLYDPATVVRQPLFDAKGARQPADALPIGFVTVAP